MSALVKVCKVSDVPPGEMKPFTLEGFEEPVAIFNLEGEIYATSNVCTHAYAQLAEGWFEPEDCTIECPLHGAKFNIETGAVLALPAYKPVKTYDVRVEDGALLVDLPS